MNVPLILSTQRLVKEWQLNRSRSSACTKRIHHQPLPTQFTAFARARRTLTQPMQDDLISPNHIRRSKERSQQRETFGHQVPSYGDWLYGMCAQYQLQVFCSSRAGLFSRAAIRSGSDDDLVRLASLWPWCAWLPEDETSLARRTTANPRHAFKERRCSNFDTRRVQRGWFG